MAADVKRIMQRQASLESAKQPWNPQFDLQGEYINLRRTNYSGQTITPEFINGELFDTTATDAMETGASALLAWLWPNGGKSFSMIPTASFEDDDEAKEWFGYVTEKMAQMMDDSDCGLATALTEVMEDAFSPCTAFLAVMDNYDENPNNPLMYEVWGLDECYIWQGKAGKVAGIHRKRLLTVTEIVDEYGIENCAMWVKEAFNANRITETGVVITAIAKRTERQTGKSGNMDMPWYSVHIDQKTNKILKESGFQEFPVMALRMQKKSNEVYGRGFGFKALPNAMELNAIWEAYELGTEKALDPPLVVLDNGTMGGGTVDTSPGAINTVRVTGRAGQIESPIRPLYEGQMPQGAEKLIEIRTKQIYDYAKLDRLLNTNDDKQMTLGESQIRDSRSTMAMNSPVVRCVDELFTPMIARTFSIGLRRGKFGYVRDSIEAKLANARGEELRYIPASIVDASEKGIQAYTLRYLSPAARMAYAAEAQGIRQTMNDAMTMEPGFPGTVSRLDGEFIIERLNEINGATSKIFLSASKAKKKQEAKQAAAEAQAAAAAGQQVSDVALKDAQTRKINNEAITQ